MENKLKRFLSLLLTVIMVISLMPTNIIAFAAESDGTESITETEGTDSAIETDGTESVAVIDGDETAEPAFTPGVYNFYLPGYDHPEVSKYLWGTTNATKYYMQEPALLADGTTDPSGRTYAEVINALYEDGVLNWGIHTLGGSSFFFGTSSVFRAYAGKDNYLAMWLDVPVEKETDFVATFHFGYLRRFADVYLLDADADIATSLTEENRLLNGTVKQNGYYTDTVTLSGGKCLLVLKYVYNEAEPDNSTLGIPSLTLKECTTPEEVVYDFELYNNSKFIAANKKLGTNGTRINVDFNANSQYTDSAYVYAWFRYNYPKNINWGVETSTAAKSSEGNNNKSYGFRGASAQGMRMTSLNTEGQFSSLRIYIPAAGRYSFDFFAGSTVHESDVYIIPASTPYQSERTSVADIEAAMADNKNLLVDDLKMAKNGSAEKAGEWTFPEAGDYILIFKSNLTHDKGHPLDKLVLKHIHTEVVDAKVEPGCESTGLTEGKHCATCGEIIVAQEEIAAQGHDKVSHEAKAATCGEIGWEAYEKCSRCDYTTYAEIPAKGHTPGAEATCTDPQTCTVCGETIKTALDHAPGAEATCTEAQVCTVCGTELKAALGHDKVSHDAKAATCEEIGWDAYEKCSRCDYTTYAEIPAKGHTPGADATCTDPQTCTVCGETIKTALDHAPGAEATCTEAQVCTVCGTELKAALGHDKASHDAKAATCEGIGWDAYETCSRCDYTTYVEIPALGHTEVIDEAKAPTCTETGLTEGKHCSVCNKVLVAQEEVKALGHTEVVDKAVAATCTTAGKTEGKHCSVCNEVLVAQEEVKALGHTEVTDAAVPATCTATGLTEGKHCSVCNEVLVAQEDVDALGHTEVTDAAVPATCTATGLTEGKHCSVCNEVLVAQEEVKALGHTKVIDAAKAPTCTENGLSEGAHCSVCEEVLYAQTPVAAPGHKWTEATYEAPKTCTVCGATEGEVLSAAAKIGDVKYATLQAAIDAAQADDIIVLATNITLDEGVVVPADKVITLDLNGKTISRNTEVASSTAAITNNGNLTIRDSVGYGKITAFAANPDTAEIPYYASNTITNSGVLTIEGGTIENSTGDNARAAYPIDNNSTLRDAILNIEGGVISGRGAIRQFANSTTHKNEVNISGGEVNGTSYAVWVQNPSSGNPVSSLNISGGKTTKLLLGASENFTASITGGTISEVAVWADESEMDRVPSGFITGGTFGSDVSAFAAEGFVCKQNGDSYGVVIAPKNFVKDEATKTATVKNLDGLKEFAAEVNGGNNFKGWTVVLAEDINLANEEWTPIGNATNKFLGTFDGGNYTISNLVVNVETNNAGLFGFASVVKNVKLVNAKVSGIVCVGALVGELESSVGTVENCHVSGTIQITGENSVGGLAGKGYANIKNSSVTGNADSFVLGAAGNTEEGDNVGGIIGHLGEGNTLGVANSTVKNIKISGTRKVGGIVGTTARANDYVGNTVENVTIACTATAEYADDNAATTTIGGIIGGYFGSATSGGILKDSTVTDVTFIVGNAKSAGALVGGDRVNNGGAPVGVEASGSVVNNVTGATNSYLLPVVAAIGNVNFETLADAIAAAQAGDTITLIADVTIASGETVQLNGVNLTANEGVKLTNNGEVLFIDVDLTNMTIDGSGTTYFYNEINFYGANAITSGINGTPFHLIVNKGANLLITRFVLGYDRAITVYGEIEDAHSFDPTGKTPSLKFNSTSGVSVGGTSVGKLTVKDAYVELDNSSWKNSYGTHTWSFENAYVSATSFGNCNAPAVEGSTWVVTFDDSVLAARNYIKNGVNTTYNFINGSVGTTGSLRIDGELYIDETSSITTTSQQNNKVGAVDEHGGINGTVIVDGELTIGSNAKTQLEVLGGELKIGENGKVALGTNTLTLDTASALTIDTTNMSAGEYTGIVGTVVNNGTINTSNDLLAEEVDGKIVLKKAPVASVNGIEYTDLKEALKAATADSTIVLLSDVVVDEYWDSRYTGAKFTVPVTINGNGHTLKFTNTVYDGGNYMAAFRFEANATVKNLTIDMSEALSGFATRLRAISAKADLTVDNCTFIGNGAENNTRAIIFGEGASAKTNIEVTNSTFSNWRFGVIDSESGQTEKEADTLEISGNTFTNANVNVSVTNKAVFKDNVMNNSYAKIVTYEAEDANVVLNVTAQGNTLTESEENYIYAKTIDAQEGFITETPYLGMAGSGTEADPYIIKDLRDLKWFRDQVNGGNTYAGKYIKLAADVDLANEEWAPIGNGTNKFQGTFDGGNNTISNLVVTGYNSNVGLFGYTENGEIKNLTVENAKVSGRLNVGVVAGTPYTSKFTNVTVTGHVEVNGMAYVGGVGGKNAYANWTDVTVNVDETSYVKANSVENGTAYRTYVGGVVGFNGEGSHTFKNISSNIKVIGSTVDIGGVFGIAHYSNNFENITFTGSVEAPDGAMEVGGIAGVWHNEKGFTVTFNNVTSTGTVTVGSETTTGSIVGGAYNAANELPENSGSLIIDGKQAWLCVAKIGDVKYATLQAAIDAAQAHDTIVLATNITLAEGVVVPADKTVTLDLNGKTITGTPAEAKAYAVINNKGDLTITGDGKILCNYQLPASTSYAVNAVLNQGELTLESGIIENISANNGQIGYGVDNNSTSAGAILVVNGGEIKVSGSNYYDAIRQFCNSQTNANDVIIEGGKVGSVWMQNPSDGAQKNTKEVKGSLTITAGEVGAVYLEPSAAFEASVSGGYIAGIATNDTANSVSTAIPSGFVTGGTFGTDVSAFVDKDHELNQNADGSYSVVARSASGKISYRGYITDNANREAIQIDLENVYARESLIVKLFDANGNLLITTKAKASSINADAYTVNAVLWGNPSGSWDTTVNTELTVANAPSKAELWIDGELVDTFENILGKSTDAAAYQVPPYLALDCVYKAAQIGNEYYADLLDALKAAKDGETVELLDDVELHTRLIFSLYTNGKNVTLDGNNHRLFASSTNWGTGNGKHLINVNCDNVTLKDIVLDCNNIAEGANIYMAQDIVFDNVSIINKKGWNADLTVNGSTLTVENKLSASYVDVSLGKGVTTDLGIVAEEGAVLEVRTLQIASAAYPNTNLDAALATDGTSYYSFKKVDTNGNLAGYSNSLSRLSDGYSYELLEDVTVNSNVTLLNAGHTGSLNTNGHTMTVADGKMLTVNGSLDVTGTGTIAGDIVLGNQDATVSGGAGLDIETTVDGSTVVYENGQYVVAMYVAQIGDVKYLSFEAAVANIATDGSDTTIKLLTDIELDKSIEFKYGTGKIIFTADHAVTVKQTELGLDLAFTIGTATPIIIGENVTFEIYDNNSGMYVYYGPSLEIQGAIVGGQNWGCLYLYNGEHVVTETGKVDIGRVQMGFNELTVNGELKTNYLLVEGATFNAEGATVIAGVIHDSNNGGQRWGASKFNLVDSNVTANNVYLKYADSVLTVDTTSTLTVSGKFYGAGKIVIDAAGMSAGIYQNITADMSEFAGKIEVINNNDLYAVIEDGKIVLKGYVAKVGEQSYASVLDAMAAAIESGASEVKILANSRELMTKDHEWILNADLTITADAPVVVDFYNNGTSYDIVINSNNNNTFTIDENVTITLKDRLVWIGYYGNNVDVIVKGTLEGKQIWHGADTTVTSTGKLISSGEAFVLRRGATLTVDGGTIEANYFSILSGNIDAKNATITSGPIWVGNTGSYANEGGVSLKLDNSTWTSTGNIKLASEKTAIMELVNGSAVTTVGAAVVDANSSIVADTSSSCTASGESVFVATTGGMQYTSLQAAIDAAQAGATVTVLKDIALAEGIEVAADKTVTLDLNGCDIVGKLNAITNNGTLTINDSVGTGNVYTTDVSAQGRATIVNNGVLTINGGWFGDSNNDTTDRNAINRGNALKNYGTATINGGYFTNVSNQYIGSDAYAYAINNIGSGNITINNATVYGDINGLIYSDGKTVVNDGSFTLGRPNEENNLWYLAYGNVEIKGGTWTRAFAVPVWNTGDPTFNGDVAVSGGVFNVDIEERFCAEGYDPATHDDGTYGVKKGLMGSGTEADPFVIKTVEDLEIFRASVNAGETRYNAPGVVVALAADIDMAGAIWERGIGDGINATFDGIFDGKNFTIKNLNMAPKADSDGYFCGGLFGYTYGAAEIKNLGLENITVTADGAGHNVGALVGFAYNKGGKLKISNISVKNVTIDAPDAYGVGAIIGYSYYAMDTIENCSVDGAKITGYSFVGGIAGYSDSKVITDCTVKNATITATSKDAGGIAGIVLSGNKISNCTVDSSVSVTGTANVGTVVGAIAANGIIVENCNAAKPLVGGNYADDKIVEARIGNKYYATLEAAVAAAQAGDDIVLLTPVVIAADETVELKLNGFNIIYTSDVMGEAMITNNGNLTIEGDGEIVYTYTGAADAAYGKGNYTIVNNGTLTVDGATIKNATAAMKHAFYTINNGNGGNVVINDGKIINENNYAIRQVSAGSITVNGGEVIGTRAVWMQAVGSNAADAPEMSLTVNGGKLVGTGEDGYKLAVYSYSYGNSLENVSITVNGGEIDGDIALSGGKNKTVAETVTITGGTITNVYSYAENDVAGNTINISGGTFANAVEEAYCAAGYIPTTNDDGTYGVKEGAYVARVDGVGYETLAEAMAAVTDGSTLTIYEGTYDAALVINKSNVTVIGEGNVTLNGVPSLKGINYKVENIDFVYATGSTNLSGTGLIKDCSFTATDATGNTFRYCYGTKDGAITFEGCELNAPNGWAVHFDQANGTDLTFIDCQINGRVALGSDLGNLTATETTFENGYVNVWGTEDAATFNDCEFVNVPYVFTGYDADNTVNFNNCTVTDADDADAVVTDIIYGGNDAAEAKIYVDGELKSGAAKIGDTYYWTLAEAIAAAGEGDTVTVLKDIELDEMIVNKKNITLDLNGKTITGTDNTEKNFSLIDNRGTLTITGNGTMTLKATVNSGWNRYSAVIANNPGGKLIVENGTIEHLGGTDMAYGIDNLTNGKGTYAETVINGGTIKSTYRAIRQFLNGVEAQNILTINGGTVEGENKSIFFHDPSKNNNTGTLTVSANAVLNGDVYLFVTEGSTEWPVDVAIADAALGNSEITSKNVPNGYMIEMTNDIWGVNKYVACINTGRNTYYYETLEAALADAYNGETITLIHDIELTAPVVNNKNIALDLNGKTLSYTSDVVGEAMITNNGDLTITDSVGEGKIVYTYTGAADSSYGKGNETILNNGKLTVESGTVENATAAMSHASYAIDNRGEVVVEGGKILNLNGHAVRMSSFSKQDNIMTVNGGYIEGTRAIQVQLPSSTGAGKVYDLTVNGGELVSNEATYNLAVYVYSNGESADNVKLNLNGGTFNGNVAINGKATETMAEDAVSVTGGTFNGDYGVFSYADDNAAGDAVIAITGGTYKTNYSEVYADSDGNVFLQNADGTYGVVKKEDAPVAYHDNDKDGVYDADGDDAYTSVAAALTEAIDGDIVRLMGSVDESTATLVIPYGVTLDVQNYTLSAAYLVGFNGSYLIGSSYNTKGTPYGQLNVPQDRIVLPGTAYLDSTASGDFYVLPVWEPTNSCYIFGRYIINERGGSTNDPRGFYIDEANNQLKLVFKFKGSTALTNTFFADGTSDNEVSFMVRISWTTADGTITQDYVYSDAMVIDGLGDRDFGIIFRGYKNATDITVTAMIMADSGIFVPGTTWSVNTTQG